MVEKECPECGAQMELVSTGFAEDPKYWECTECGYDEDADE